MRGHSLTIGKPQAASPRRESSPLPPPPAAAAVAAANPVAHLSLVVAGEGREEGVMAAAVREVGSKAELEAAVGGARAAAVHFWAAWCEASKQMDEVFAHLAVDFPHAVFLRVEAEEQPEISEAYGVAAVPYFVFLKQNGASATSSAEDALNKRLEQLVNSHPVFLFMKGTPEQPRCGFSRKVVDVLKQEGVEFGSFDILTDNDVREGMKKFSNWPTFPQLYCKGELLGGCDIVIAMHESGELKDVFKEHNIPLQPQGRKNEEAVKAEPDTEKSGAVPEPALLTAAQKARLESLVNSSPVMVFIKGTPEEPKCGFSGKLVHILKQEKIPFSSFDILTDDEVRQGLKVLSNWPSYPQLYINGELVGGSDIVMEMHKSGELKKVLSEKGIIAKESLEDRLKALISSAPVMLFMKGTPDAPRCGFSSKVVNALKQAGVSFGSFDILSDEEVRQGLKTYSNWPTFPQLYYKTELIGGCDIVLELEKSGELKSTLSELRDDSGSRNGTRDARRGANAHASGRTASVSEGHVFSNHNGTDGPLIIPGVLLKDVVSDLPVHLLGYGNIAYRLWEAIKGNKKISKIWCAWVGQDGSHGLDGCDTYEQSDFAIINFSYTFELGRKWSSDDQDLPISAGSFFVIDDAGHRGKRRKKSFSDQEASSEESNGQSSSAHDNSQAIITGSPTGTSHNLQVGLLSSKSMRRELRKQKRLAAEKACDICGRPMLLEKDVATLLNCKTGNLACSSRNSSGAFHLFHTSCLVHWTILCQYEILADKIASKGKSNRGRKAKNAPKKITSILCPECQGTGIHIEGDDLEKPTISLSEMFRYKLKAIEAHKAWMKSPEVLENCSTGLHFPAEHIDNSEEQEVMPLKSLAFYAADG
uniref:Thioredoxin domain-containing protein n=1 Tax=Oryza punctata TaxID=4537 RepID=A0A0E0M9C9_ORYPU